MMRRWRTLVAALLVAFAALTAGCATTPVEEGVRAAFGSVAVVASDEPCEIEIAHPTAGWGAGLGMGFVRGVSAIVEWPLIALDAAASGFRTGGESGVAAVVIFALSLVVPAVLAVLWLPCSIAGGAITAIPVDEAEAAEQVLVATARDCGNSARVAAAMEEAARRRGGEPVPRESADTIVEVRLLSIERGRSWNWWTFDRAFPIQTEAGVRVIRRADGVVLWEATETAGSADSPWTPWSAYSSAPSVEHTYLEWAAGGGALLRAEIESQLSTLGGAFAVHVFGEAQDTRPVPSPGEAPIAR